MQRNQQPAVYSTCWQEDAKEGVMRISVSLQFTVPVNKQLECRESRDRALCKATTVHVHRRMLQKAWWNTLRTRKSAWWQWNDKGLMGHSVNPQYFYSSRGRLLIDMRTRALRKAWWDCGSAVYSTCWRSVEMRTRTLRKTWCSTVNQKCAEPVDMRTRTLRKARWDSLWINNRTCWQQNAKEGMMGHCESTTPVDKQKTPVDRRTLTGGVMIKLYSGKPNPQQYMLKIKM